MNNNNAGQGLMHADGYTMTRITDEGCANYNPTQAIIIILIISCLFRNSNNNNNNNAGRGLMHAEGLYDDEDRSTDEGVLIRIKLKAIMMCLSIIIYDDDNN